MELVGVNPTQADFPGLADGLLKGFSIQGDTERERSQKHLLGLFGNISLRLGSLRGKP